MNYGKGIAALVLLLGLVAFKIKLERPLVQIPRNPAVLEALQAQFQSRSLKKFALGFDGAIADSLWIQLLQNVKYQPVAAGKLSWEFSQLDAITTLDPKFETAYAFGSSFVSFFRRDKEGGKTLLEKWARFRPGYWRAEHLLGMHYLLELGDAENAATHVLKASAMPGAPEWLRSLGVRILTTSGAWTHALQAAVDLYPSTQDPDARHRLQTRIRSLRFNLQKKGWSEALSAYRARFHREPHALRDLDELYPQSTRRVASQINDIGLSALLSEKFRFEYSPKICAVVASNRQEEQELKDLDVYDPSQTSEAP